MDILRPELKKRKRRRIVLTTGTAVLAICIGGLFFARMNTAMPTVETTVWTDTVKRGPLLRQVRGPGSLIPREDRIRLIPAETDATVVRIRVLPGARVEPNTILMDLTDPELQQQLLDAKLQLLSARAEYRNMEARLQSELLAQRADAATVGADERQAQVQAQTDKSLYDLGVISGLSYSASRGKADELQQRNDLARQRLKLNQDVLRSELAPQQAKVQQAEAILALRQKQQDALSVTAGISGVLVDLPHQVGEHVAIGTTLAKVVQPDQLKAALKIGETQARDIQIGQPAQIDTHNGIISGRVTRIDPAVQNGTVTVDVELIGAIPPGGRPDLSVDGTIDLDRINDTLYVGRPALGNENSTISMFRVSPDGKTAMRVQVKVGMASATSIQILNGLSAGDIVILSDMSRWNSADRIRLQNQ